MRPILGTLRAPLPWMCALLLFANIPATSASVYGHVRLSTPEECANLHVLLRNLDSARTIELHDDHHCHFGQSGIAAGAYELTAHLTGYYDYASDSFFLAPTTRLLHDPSLRAKPTYSLTDWSPGFLASLISVVLALLAIIVGVFELPRYFKRPTFVVYAESREPYCHTADVFFQHPDRQEPTTAQAGSVTLDIFRCSIHFCRIWVGNNGTNDANHVEAFATRVFRQTVQSARGPRFDWVRSFRPMNLRWANSWQISREPSTVEPNALTRNRISARTGRFLDLGFVVHPRELEAFVKTARLPSRNEHRASLKASDSAVLFLTLDALGNDPNVTLREGTYVVELEVDCDSVQAERFYLHLEVGRWHSASPTVTVCLANKVELAEIKVTAESKTQWMKLVAWWRKKSGHELLAP